MAVTRDTIAVLATRPLDELAPVRAVEPRGARPEALGEAARALRARLLASGPVRAVRTIDAGPASLPARAAFGGAVRTIGPDATVVERIVVVEYEDVEGAIRTLAWGVRDAHRGAAALERAGLSPDAVDHIVLGDLFATDVAALTGVGERRSPFPNAPIVVQGRELAAATVPHPAQRVVYAGAALDHAEHERLAPVEGDVLLGNGVALLWTPGRSEGHQTLCLVTGTGIRALSGNGVCADNWHPHLSKIPGVRAWAELSGAEVVPCADAPGDQLAQHDAMLLEKAVADSDREDPRWVDVLPTRLLVRTRRGWPLAATFVAAGADEGAMTR